MPDTRVPLVQIRTTTFRRPEALKRCLESLKAQTWANWVCDVFDDDPEGSANAVIDALADPRIHHNPNRPQKYASRNIDQCFTKANRRSADYFCVVEDDNFILPRFIEDNIAICRDEGVEIVLRNQLVEYDSATPAAYLGTNGVLDRQFVEGRYTPDLFRMAVLANIGVSNGGLFWSRNAESDLEIGVRCSATLQEYMRTCAIAEPIYVAMTPLAVWAQNGADTQRDLGVKSGHLRRELSLKRSIGILQRKAWSRARPSDRANFMTLPAFASPRQARARGLVKALIRLNVGDALSPREKAHLIWRGLLIRTLGRPEPDLAAFLRTRGL